MPLLKGALQVVPQSMPAGELVILPLPPLVTVSAYWAGGIFLNVAVTFLFAVIATLQPAVPVHAPLHPSNV